MIVGLTGGIASGKSLVTDFLRELDVPVIDTDEIARQIVAPGQPAWLRLRETFGEEYFLADGQLDRKKLADLVFTDPAALKLLNGITHPAIFDEVDRRISVLLEQPAPPLLIVVIVPLLFEVDAASRFDCTILVSTPSEQQLERLVGLRGYSREDAKSRIAAQLPLAEKELSADYILDNSGSAEDLRLQVIKLVNNLQKRVS